MQRKSQVKSYYTFAVPFTSADSEEIDIEAYSDAQAWVMANDEADFLYGIHEDLKLIRKS